MAGAPRTIRGVARQVTTHDVNTRHRAMFTVVVSWMAYLLVLLLFLAFAKPVYSIEQRLLGWLVFVFGTGPMLRFARRPQGVPLFEFVLVQYVLFFSMPLFYQTSIGTFSYGQRRPAEEAITMTLICVLLALVSLLAGHALAKRALRIRAGLLSFSASPLRLFLVGVVAAIGGTLFLSASIAISASFAQPLLVIFSQDLGIALLGLLCHQKKLTRWQEVIARSLFGLNVLVGLTAGSMQTVLQPVVIWMLAKWIAQRKGPKFMPAIIVLTFFLVQPIKSAYRDRVWYGAQGYSFVEKVTLYGKLVASHWGEVLGGKGTVAETMETSADTRLSLLLSTAHYVELTPSQFDYKRGETLAYMIYTWVPRFIWKEKPTAQLANKILPVQYGIQSLGSSNTTMFGVGHVAEAYVNFGMLGIVPVFLTLGLFYYLPILLIRTTRETAGLAIIIAVTANMMWIESTISNVFGGVIQQLLVQAILLRAIAGWPAVSRADPSLPNSSSARPVV